MKLLLDTNVVSEWVRPSPDPGVARFLAELDEDRAFLSVVTVAELRFGIERLKAGVRRSRLEQWVTVELAERFAGRVLGVDVALAELWGVVLARGRTLGRPLSAMDALIAATASAHALTIVTRNVADFQPLGLSLYNPWKR